jgi:L-threonylcarbamoyladenylate synthase
VLAHRCADPGDSRITWIAAGSDPAAYAHDLYAHLRALDALGADFILVEAPPADPAWAAIADRLGRAAVGSGEADET